MTNKQIILDYDEYLQISGWAKKYLEVLEYAKIPLIMIENHRLDKDTSHLYLKGILRKLGDDNAD